MDFEEAVKVMHEILLEPLFAGGTIEAERGSILKELGDKKSNPSEMVWEVYRRLFFQGTEVGRSTLGSEESIKAISKQDLLDFYGANIVSGRMILIVSGGVGIEEIKQRAEETLLVEQSSRIKIGADLPVIRERQVSVEKYVGKDQVHLAFGFRTPGVFHPDKPALEVVANVLGGGRASTLTRKLRYERGLVYSVNAWSTNFCDAGTWVVKTSTSKDKLQEVLDVTAGEIERVVEKGLTEKEIRFAKDKIIKSKRNEMQTSSSWVDFHAYMELVGNKKWTLTDYVDEIELVTIESAIKVAEMYFKPEKWYLALCGDVDESFVQVRLT